MDPLSIATSVVGLTATCLSTCKKLRDLAGAYEDVPVIIAAICSESTVISIGLSELQMKILRRDDLSQAWASRTEVWGAFETALTGCMIVFSCLEAETRHLQPRNPGVWAKLKFIWNQDRLKELLSALRGQQASIAFLLQVLETDTLSNIQRNIRRNGAKIQATASEAQSLRSRNPSIRMESQSIFDNDATKLSFFDVETISGVAPSELDFEFDNLVLNSQAYRRAFAKAQAERQKPEVHVAADVDDSDTATVREISQDLSSMYLSVSPQFAVGSSRDPPDHRRQVSDSTPRPAESKAIRSASAPPRIDCSTSYPDPMLPKDSSHPSPEEKMDLVEEQSNALAFQSDQNKRDSKSPALEKTKPSRMCFQCSKPLTGKFVRTLGQNWHLECFNCDDCGNIVVGRYYPTEETSGIPQKPLCETDYFRRLDLLCFQCDEPLRGYHLTAGGRKYHIGHFTCDECERTFGEKDTYYKIANGVYCQLHYLQKCPNWCDACKFPILGQYLEIDGGVEKRWHPECRSLVIDWGISLPLSRGGIGYLTSIHRGVLDDSSRQSQKKHEKCIERILRTTANFCDVFQNNLTLALQDRQEFAVFEKWKLVLSLASCLFGAALQFSKHQIDYSLFRIFDSTFQSSLTEIISGSKPPLIVAETMTKAIKPVLKVAFDEVLNESVASWDAGSDKFDALLSTLSTKQIFAAWQPYVNEPTGDEEEDLTCEWCHESLQDKAYAYPSKPGLKWHRSCFRCLVCSELVWVLKAPRLGATGSTKCSGVWCGREESVELIPSYAQVIYHMWRAWSQVTTSDLQNSALQDQSSTSKV